MAPVILGLDIGGANLKAATADRRAAAVPFALWREPDRLAAVLAELVGRFPEAEEIAVTMTGELCDCFRTKRDGVNHILTAVLNVSRSRPVWVWGTDGTFRHTEAARQNHLKVASANWHALASYAGRFAPQGPGVLLDVGSTTTDVIPLLNGLPAALGRTDPDRLANTELIYTGVSRTPLCALMGVGGAAELFATTADVYLLLGRTPEDAANTDTADRRPATRACAHARIARMQCSDAELMSEADAVVLAEEVARKQRNLITYSLRAAVTRITDDRRRHRETPRVRMVLSGSGEFLARDVVLEWFQVERLPPARLVEDVLSLSDHLGPELSACAPAHAVAVLLAERRP